MSLPLPSPEILTGAATGAAALFVFVRKVLARKRGPKPEPVTRTEFHHEMSAMRDRIGASHIAIAELMTHNHKELLERLDRQVTRINHLESGLARVDERTRSL